jgi:hypothetical protein
MNSFENVDFATTSSEASQNFDRRLDDVEIEIEEDPNTFMYCDFSFLPNCLDNAIVSACRTITRLECWDFIKSYKPARETGFMFDMNSRMNIIANKINDDYPSHSGWSYAWTMRNIQLLCEIGFEKYKKQCLEN